LLCEQAPTSSGWLGSGVGAGAVGADRPKSAGLMSTLTGTGTGSSAARNVVSATTQQQPGSAAMAGNGSNTLSYGSLKNRFLSGTKAK
jgi:hypothetical protein